MRVLINDPGRRTARRLAERVETSPGVQAVIVSDARDPAEVRSLIAGARIDTLVEMRPDAARIEALADTGVRKVVVKSSAHYYGFEAGAPAFLSEEARRERPPRGGLERDTVAAEAAAAALARRGRRIVTVLRFADEIGTDEGPHQALLRLPVLPAMLGFDPRWQLIHEHDVLGVLAHAVSRELRGIFNAAADGVLSLSEVASLLGKPLLPVLPPVGVGLAAEALARFGIPAPVELLGQLRLGRGLDNRRLKATGYDYRYTSREAVLRLAADLRPRPLLNAGEKPVAR